MVQVSKIKRLSTVVCLVSAGLLLSGTKACQEDYDLGSRTEARPTSTPTVTPTPTETPDEDVTPTGTATPSATATPSVPTPTPSGAQAFLGALSGIGVVESENYYGLKQGAASESAIDPIRIGENWLGRSFIDGSEASDEVLDTDGDGFTDGLESALGSNLRDEYSQPRLGASVLIGRFRNVDDDYDGLSNGDEARLGSNPLKADSDGDGARDGAEYASESNLLDAAVMPDDSDGDGLGDGYEGTVGTNPRVVDTDGDRLPDDMEIAIGSNPLLSDTDGDGVLDGREYQGGSDPTIRDYAA